MLVSHSQTDISNLILKVIVFSDGAFGMELDHEDEALMNGISAL